MNIIVNKKRPEEIICNENLFIQLKDFRIKKFKEYHISLTILTDILELISFRTVILLFFIYFTSAGRSIMPTVHAINVTAIIKIIAF